MTARSALAATASLLVSTVLVGCGGSSPAAITSTGADGGEAGIAPKGGADGSTPSDTGTSHPADASEAGAAATDATTGGPDGSVVGPAPADAGTWDALPAIVQVANADGGVQSTPTVVAVFFSNEDQTLLPQLEAFYTGLGATNYWKAAAEYGVGALTTKVVVLPTPAPATIDDSYSSSSANTALQTWLLGEITSGALPASTPNTSYMINYPATTTVTADGTQCQTFDGYHVDLQDASNNLISYGVIPRCTDPGSTVLVTFGSSVSHEVIEATTDPYPNYQPAWYEADDAHLFFDLANSGSEVGDMCQYDPEAYAVFPDFPYTVQRFWSNKAALAGHDPCVPAVAGTTFFNAVPELPDTGSFAYYNSTVQVSSVHIPVGATRTVFLDLYSDGPTADWTVNVMDGDVFNGAAASAALLTFSQPTTTGNNGTRLAVDVTVKAAGNGNSTTANEVTNAELFAVISTQGTGQNAPTHYWYGVVTN